MDASSSFHATPCKNKSSMTKTHSNTTYRFTIFFLASLIFFHTANIWISSKIHEEIQKKQSQDQKPRSELRFYPLKNPKIPPYTDPNRTWFMGTLTGKSENGIPEHFVFPSHPPNNKILCLNIHDGSYSLAHARDSFPATAKILRGLSFIADSFYDYENPWHSMNSLAVFFTWMQENQCLKPERFVVFKNGDIVKKVGSWISALLKACLGGELHIESNLESYGTVCFEKAVIFRRGLGKMSTQKRHELFEMLRCRAWSFCDVSDIKDEENGGLRISLVGREGKRSFKNESAVRAVMEKECDKFAGCRLKLVHMGNMSFCDQVRLMATTDVLASTHGAQLTNMMFMPRGSSVMEMFPKGWLEGAGIGQYIYHWFASWSEMNHEGAWRDTSGPDCLEQKHHPSKCFLLQKDWPVGLNETYLASWTNRVIKNRIKTRNIGLNTSPSKFKGCPCDN